MKIRPRALQPMTATGYVPDIQNAAAVILQNVGTTNVLPNDFVGGTIGTGQYDQWRSHFGESWVVGTGVSLGAVPEPTAIIALVAAAPVLLLSRRRT